MAPEDSLENSKRAPTFVKSYKYEFWMGEIGLDENLSYEERSVKILDRKVNELRRKQISLVKILLGNHGMEEATWEVEEEIQKKYPELFLNQGMNFENEILLRGEGCEDPNFFYHFLTFILFYWLI